MLFLDLPFLWYVSDININVYSVCGFSIKFIYKARVSINSTYCTKVFSDEDHFIYRDLCQQGNPVDRSLYVCFGNPVHDILSVFNC